jgi:NAD(P)-dependent dehydrogenase (short-subunit alcohol dehydrogenase family)
VYLNEHDDAAATKRRVEAAGGRCANFAGDVGLELFCRDVVHQTVAALGQLDILVNNAAEQHPQDGFAKITASTYV